MEGLLSGLGVMFSLIGLGIFFYCLSRAINGDKLW